MRSSRGFTLIELMIVIAILAVLLAIAIPAYQDYTIRARVSEGLNAVGPAKTAVVEAFHANGAVPDQASTGFTSYQTEHIQNISIAGDGTGAISVVTRNTGANPAVSLIYRPVLDSGEPTTWTCELAAGQPKYVPAECRP